MRSLWIYFIMLAMLCLAFSSCMTRSATISAYANKRDTVTVVKNHTDSVFLHDSIYYAVIGDTIYRERWHTQYKYKYIYRDSISIVHDTIRTNVEVVRSVPYTPKTLQYLSALGVLSIVYVIVRIFFLGRRS